MTALYIGTLQDSSTNAFSNLPLDWSFDSAKTAGEIALEQFSASLSDLSKEELLSGFEKTRQKVFEEFYGAIK
ncbi:MAG TPA: hypothetical protein DCK95_00615 [Anaerolineaceae bacterium]|uniref:Uncharacterized protein n=1 Tax=Anaerolinea thermophila TaxID=167964 RepID=A0A124FN78_9CHLR|nr:MAG: hypothetical protein XD73_0013 [Anaerolinea thermophila]HAF60811.1 hypothetical protein [Anaerolineaceae bacterium]